MYQLIYVSSAVMNFARPEFMELALHTGARNVKFGITGMLVFKDGSFMQVLEGNEEIIKTLYAKIEVDPRHTLVSVIHEGEISMREYGSWAMTYFNHDTEQYDHIAYPTQVL
ncbi:hypothetical protein CBI30_05185 [Polynucleobacter aenigmaticus]|uniref:BLUF domain-containing protein n=1 Tax=Polynucleobacter aenigmaticus TaxID=1743164 RepID=A0A254Q2Q1_9BURK|nr:BLUF domain-containing protein [Polynucleobacter aenigmaticus]OWS71846.1 hypothetical protein CBI30_05185 [Polynucleobacter aenigmaticus]